MQHDKALQYYKLAKFQANLFSKDPSTKVGALVLAPSSLAVLTRGYNGLPRGCDDFREDRLQRPEKYNWFEHAERNAIYNAARPYLKHALALLTDAPNMDCARGLASVGVSSVIAMRPHPDADVMLRVRSLFAEVGIEFVVRQMGEVSQLAKAQKVDQFLCEAMYISENFPKAGMPQSAALLLSPGDYSQLSSGWSGLPRQVSEGCTCRHSHDEEPFWVEHAARNAIYNAARPYLEGGIAIATMFPCAPCARGLVQVGVQTVIAPYQNPTVALWDKHFDVSREMFSEAGVDVLYVEDLERELAG